MLNPTNKEIIKADFTEEEIKAYFTEEEWDALFDAICEYKDHGPKESDMSDQIQSKISKLFN